MRRVQVHDPLGMIETLALASSRRASIPCSLPELKRPPIPWEVFGGSGFGLRYAVSVPLPASFVPPIRSSITTMPRTQDRIAENGSIRAEPWEHHRAS